MPSGKPDLLPETCQRRFFGDSEKCKQAVCPLSFAPFATHSARVRSRWNSSSLSLMANRPQRRLAVHEALKLAADILPNP